MEYWQCVLFVVVASAYNFMAHFTDVVQSMNIEDPFQPNYFHRGDFKVSLLYLRRYMDYFGRELQPRRRRQFSADWAARSDLSDERNERSLVSLIVMSNTVRIGMI